MQRAVKAINPFEFRADFAPANPLVPLVADGPDRISLTGQELAALIAQARQEALAESARQAGLDDLGRLRSLGGELSQVLADLVALAAHVEAVQYDTATENRVRALIDNAARRIIDGQGDLFAFSKDLVSRLDTNGLHGPEDKA